MYDSYRDYELEEALRDIERYCDADEREVVNRPQDDADDWQANCLTEEQHNQMLANVANEYHEDMERIRRRYNNDL